MSFNVAGLTFAEAYMLRKRMEGTESRFSKHRKTEVPTMVSNMADLDMVMHKIVHDFQEESKGVVRYTKTTLKDMPISFVKHVTTWHDTDLLDLIHHVIINNKPELLSFILGETSYFPSGYIPMYNPYAHLAAILGHTECLKIILQHRPGAFFKSDKPSHAIKLPDAIMRKTKLNESVKSVPKGAEKILEKIKYSTKNAERMMQSLQTTDSFDSDITDVLGKELGAIEKSFVKTKKRLPKVTLSKDRLKHERRKSITKEKPAEESRHPAALASVKKFAKAGSTRKLRKVESEDNFSDHFRRRLKPGREKHRITVFWDALNNLDVDLGVVRGAGAPVSIKRSPLASIPKPNIDLDRINFNAPFAESSYSSIYCGAIALRHKSNAMIHKIASSHSKVSTVGKRAMKTFEVGVRGTRRYKEFQLKPNVHQPVEKDDSDRYMNKTPLTYAAERGHYSCVKLLLDMVVLKRHPTVATREPLTLATKARSPEAIILLLDKRVSRNDYQSAVMLAIREMYPDCLTALLTNRGKDRTTLFDGTNLYHILYSQSVISSRRYEMMPEMTRALISCKEDVNSHGIPRTYPIYSLINCAFNISVGKQIFFFIECLNILLECKANPHFDEDRPGKSQAKTDMFSRQPFTSAISCVFESAKNSVNFFESSYWSNLFMKKFITTIELHDLTPRRLLNNVLFDYMDAVCALGLDRTIVRCLLRYGGNPDFKREGKYPVNVYFDQLLPYLTRFEIIGTYERYRQELTTLMIVCRAMSFQCLQEALLIFLSDHLLSAPLQALPITREFASLMDQLLRNPRPLSELAAHVIWVRTRRNKKKVRALPISEGFMSLIIP